MTVLMTKNKNTTPIVTKIFANLLIAIYILLINNFVSLLFYDIMSAMVNKKYKVNPTTQSLPNNTGLDIVP